MTDTYYIDALPKGATKIIVKIEQPPEGYELDEVLPYEGNAYFYKYNAIDHGYYTYRVLLPLPIGAKVGVKEAFELSSFIDEGSIAYVSEHSSKIKITVTTESIGTRTYYPDHPAYKKLRQMLGNKPWLEDIQPASTMPDEAIRKWFTVTAVEVKQVKDLTDDDVKATGNEGDLFKLFADLDIWVEIATVEER